MRYKHITLSENMEELEDQSSCLHVSHIPPVSSSTSHRNRQGDFLSSKLTPRPFSRTLRAHQQNAASAAESAISPYAAATLLITTLHHGFSAFYCWEKYGDTDQTGFLLGFAGSAVMASFGLWCVMFGGEKARISKRTGADKRVSGFPFSNKEADKKRRKAI